MLARNDDNNNFKLTVIGMVLLTIILLAGMYATCGTPERYCVTNYSTLDATTNCLAAIKGGD